ncbi:hypothetical protein [Enterococcus rivorum]|uniref:hypothetical protein n=1 Tax=Enterococcus rivorum TaxID=762845 RepID=UPI00363320FD
MKKRVCLPIVFLVVLSLSSLGVTASAEQKEKEASIIYYNAKEVTNADYILTIPSKLAFTQKNKRLDASVTMYDVNGDFYTGDKSVKVSVESKNNYNLRSTDDFMDIKYSMVNLMMLVSERLFHQVLGMRLAYSIKLRLG